MKAIRWALAVSLLAGLTLIYFYEFLFSENIFTFRDLSRYYYPLRLFASNLIKTGHFPFWNPFVGSGHPLFASLQSVVLYPPSLVYYLLNFDFAFNFFIVLHIFLGGLFFYLLMRDLKFNHLSSLISAVTFMFGGYLIAVINLTTTLASAVWFPLVFLFYNRALSAGKIINLTLSSFFLGLMFLAGEPTPMYATVFLLGLFSLNRIISEKKRIFEIIILYVSFIAIFALLFSFQILPFLELIKLSNRSQSLFSDSVYWSFPPRDLVNLLLPFFYGPLQFQNDAGFRQDWLLLTYLGVIPVILFLLSFIFSRDKFSNFFKVIFLIGIIMIFGKFTPVYKLFYKFVPGFGLIRYPVKFFFLSAVSFAFLAGSGWQKYYEMAKVSDPRLIKFIKRLFFAAFIAALIFLTLYLSKNFIASRAWNYIERLDLKEKYDKFKYFLIFNVDFFNFRRMLLFFILGALGLFFGAKKKAGLALTGGFIFSLIFIDLYGGKNIEVNPVIKKEVFHKVTPNIAFLKKDKSLFRVFASAQMNKLNETLRGNTYEEAFAASVDDLCSNRLIEYGIYDARGYFSIHNANYSKVLNLVDTSPLPSSTNILSMLNVKYILTPKEIDDKQCELVNKGLSSFLYENKAVLPRSYLVPKFVVLKQEADIANKLKSKEFFPAKEVVLEEEPLSPQVSPNLAKQENKEYVNILIYEPNQAVIEANVLNQAKFLILADNYYPGWQVFVDAKQGKIYKANYILRGVYLPAGKHIVRFVYNPVSFKIGSLISLSCLFALIILILIDKTKDKNEI